jgi:hypothetical protein
VGAYELVLQGEPATPEDFQPFELRFPVTVAAGQAVPSPAVEAEAEDDQPLPSESDLASGADSQSSAADNPIFWQAGMVLALIGGTIALLLGKNKIRK